MFPRDARIEGFDPELAAAIAGENRRQEDHVELIASENYASPRVMEAQGSHADQQVRRRLSGQALLRRLRIRRHRRAPGDRTRASSCSAPTTRTCSRIRVRRPTRPCTWRCCSPGDTILGMSLAHGGHLTHGAKVNFSGKLFNAVQYGVDDKGLIDYDEVERLALEHKPKMIVAGFSAYSQIIDWAQFRAIADKVGALPVRRHGARRRPRRRGRVPEPGAARRRRHLHHAQDAARPARRHHRREGATKTSRRSCSRSCSPASRAAR